LNYPNRILLLSILSSFLLIPTAYCYQDVAGEYKSDRMNLVNSSLDDVERRKAGKIDYAKKPIRNSYSQPVVQDPSNKNSDLTRFRTPNPYQEIKRQKEAPPKQPTIEFGQENSSINYQEPNVMKEKGHMHGIFGSVVYRPVENKPAESLKDYFSEDSQINVYKLDAKISWGRVNYASSQGTLSKLEDSMFEVRGLIGYDMPIKSTLFTPYMGLGIRNLKNDLRGTIVQPDLTEVKGYRRSSRYLYLPIGIDTRTKMDNDISVGINLEYDFLINGKQKSHLEDIDPDFETLTNGQGNGFGFKSSLSLRKDCQNYNVFIEPFFRYWNIADSEISPVIYTDAIVGYGIEPKNNSKEFGFKIGLDF